MRPAPTTSWASSPPQVRSRRSTRRFGIEGEQSDEKLNRIGMIKKPLQLYLGVVLLTLPSLTIGAGLLSFVWRPIIVPVTSSLRVGIGPVNVGFSSSDTNPIWEARLDAWLSLNPSLNPLYIGLRPYYFSLPNNGSFLVVGWWPYALILLCIGSFMLYLRAKKFGTRQCVKCGYLILDENMLPVNQRDHACPECGCDNADSRVRKS
jgi:hypothetical protein